MVQYLFLLVFVGTASSGRKRMAKRVELKVEGRNVYIDVAKKMKTKIGMELLGINLRICL
jgi:hypothetical protein